jgi:hypothetical protein
MVSIIKFIIDLPFIVIVSFLMVVHIIRKVLKGHFGESINQYKMLDAILEYYNSYNHIKPYFNILFWSMVSLYLLK